MVFLAPSYIGHMYNGSGLKSPVTGETGWWVFLDWVTVVVGSIIWFVKVQRALNIYWKAKAGVAAAP